MKKLLPIFAFAVLGLTPVAALSADEGGAKDFVADAIKGDNSEIMLGQLAEKKGASEGVRS